MRFSIQEVWDVTTARDDYERRWVTFANSSKLDAPISFQQVPWPASSDELMMDVIYAGTAVCILTLPNGTSVLTRHTEIRLAARLARLVSRILPLSPHLKGGKEPGHGQEVLVISTVQNAPLNRGVK